MAKHKAYTTNFKRAVAQEYLSGETLHGLAKRHGISRNLIRIWVEKYEAGALDEEILAADMLQQHEACIAALEHLVGKLSLENEFLKGALRNARRAKNETSSIVTSPMISPSRKVVGVMHCPADKRSDVERGS